MTNAADFEKTAVLFEKLVNVETYARMFGGDLAHLQTTLKDGPPKKWYYVAPPDDVDPPELRELIEEQRANFKHKAQHEWTLLDRFHASNRRWRKAIEEAKRAADDATWELDPLPVPPLERVAVKIKRTLQDMGGSVPAPMVFGDLPPLESKHLDRLRERDREVEKWVDEIRLLVYPRAPEEGQRPCTTPSVPDVRDDNAAVASSTPDVTKPELHVMTKQSRPRGRPRAPEGIPSKRQGRILVTLMQRSAISRETAQKVSGLVDPTQGLTKDTLKKLFMDLRQAGLTDGQPGVGVWLTESGLAAARGIVGAQEPHELGADNWVDGVAAPRGTKAH